MALNIGHDVEGAAPLHIHVSPIGIEVTANGVLILAMLPAVAATFSSRLAEAVALYEKHYRAFRHDETTTTH